MFYDNYVAICKQHGKKPSPVAVELGLNSSNVAQWKKGSTPRPQVLQKIADYFGVSVGYLLGYEQSENGEKPTPVTEGGLNETAQRFMPLVDKLTLDQQQLLLAQLQAWTEQNERLSPAAPDPDAGKAPESDS